MNTISLKLPLSLPAKRSSFKKSSLIDGTRACIMPGQTGQSSLLTPDTVAWLNRLNSNTDFSFVNPNKSDYLINWTLPILGITNRSLPGYKKAGFNFFKTIVKLIVPPRVTNLDQCIIEFGFRQPISGEYFINELDRQICLSGSVLRKNTRLTLYAPSLNNAAVVSDIETLRVVIQNAVPAINIDWLDAHGNWDLIWNPCSQLKDVKKQLETKLAKFLDDIVERICINRCRVTIKSPQSFLKLVYLPHRRDKNLPELKKVGLGFS